VYAARERASDIVQIEIALEQNAKNPREPKSSEL
jgi:hypothetical protein